MIDLSISDTDELEDRVRDLLSKLDERLKQAGPLIEEIGRLRTEVIVINDELDARRAKNV